MKKHIIVIDDDTRLRNLLGKFLEENNFQTTLAKDASEAKEILSNNKADMLIVDVMMPIESGIEFTASIRQKSSIPIIMLTAKGEVEDRIKGLEVGADDYLPTTFEPKELLLRINNIFKRLGFASQDDFKNDEKKIDDNKIYHFGQFTFSVANSRLKKGEDFIHLTESEAKILAILCQEIGNPISRETMSQHCGGIDDRSIDVQITRLRRKIENNPKQPFHLQTVRNYGYVLFE